MSPPANRVQVVAGSYASAAAGAGRLRGQRPVGELLDPIDAEQRLAAPGQGAHLRPDRVRPQEGQPLAVLGQVRGEGRFVGERDDVGRIGIGDAERAEDRGRLPVDEGEAIEAAARAGQDRGDVLGRGARERRSEARDRHDRHVDDRRRRGVAGVGLAVGDGLPEAPAPGGVLVVVAVGPAVARAAADVEAVGDAAGPDATDESERTGGDHRHDGDEEQADRDRDGASGHGREFDRGDQDRPPEGRDGGPGAKGTPRPGGRTGRREMRMADPTGFEPAISSVTGWHVGPLHHGSSCGEGGA